MLKALLGGLSLLYWPCYVSHEWMTAVVAFFIASSLMKTTITVMLWICGHMTGNKAVLCLMIGQEGGLMSRQPKFTDVVMSEHLVPAVLEKTVFCITSNLHVLCLPSLHCVYTKASSIFIKHPLSMNWNKLTNTPDSSAWNFVREKDNCCEVTWLICCSSWTTVGVIWYIENLEVQFLNLIAMNTMQISFVINLGFSESPLIASTRNMKPCKTSLESFLVSL